MSRSDPDNNEQESTEVSASPRLPISPSARLPISPSPHLPNSPSPSLHFAASPRPRVSPSRVLLWDIDGTLIRSARTGAFKDYTIPMLEQVFGTSGRLAEMQVSGMTDLQLVAEALRDEGFTHKDVRDRIDHLRERYMEEMKRATGNGEEFFELLPGVRETLAAIAAEPRYRSALLTGNIEAGSLLENGFDGSEGLFRFAGCVWRRVA